MRRFFGIRRVLLVSCCIAVSLLMFAGISHAQEVIKIGIVAGLTGATASWGGSVQQMCKIISQEIDEAGGFKVGNKKVKVEFKYYDSESSPEVAATQAEKAIAAGCTFILAGPQSAVDFTVSEHCQRAGVIYVNPYNVLDKLAERGYDHYFRTCGDISVYVEEGMKYLLAQEQKAGVKAKNVAIFTNDNVVCSFAGDKYLELIPKMAPHWKIVDKVYYPGKATDFTMWLNAFKAKGVDLALGIGYPGDTILSTRQYREIDYNPMAIHGVLGGHYDPEYGSTLKWQAIYVTDTAYFSPDLNVPGLAEFNEKYKSQWKDPIPNNAANVAVSLTVVKHAVERAGSLKTKDLLAAMRSTDIKRLEYKKGDWWYIIPDGCKFNEKGENIRARGVTTMWTDPLNQKPVYPFELATHKAPWPRPTWAEIEKEYGAKYPFK